MPGVGLCVISGIDSPRGFLTDHARIRASWWCVLCVISTKHPQSPAIRHVRSCPASWPRARLVERAHVQLCLVGGDRGVTGPRTYGAVEEADFSAAMEPDTPVFDGLASDSYGHSATYHAMPTSPLRQPPV